MLSILINAYACSPGMGSEPGMAWNWCANLANYCELHIITEGEFRDRIEAVVPTLPQGRNMHFYYNSVSDEVRRMCWNQGDWRFYKHYKGWQKKTYLMAKEICSREKIDILHQLNMIGFREPGYLWKLAEEVNKPFVWGPVDAKDKFPLAYTNGASLKTKMFLWLKNTITCFQLRYSQRVLKAARNAYILVSASSNSVRSFKNYMGLDSILLNETGCGINRDAVMPKKNKNTFDLLWVGKLDFRKQLSLALRSLATAYHDDIRLHIVGGGDTSVYLREIELLGISDLCIVHGAVSHDEVQSLMQKADFLFFTSVAEGTPHVVLEAISNGLPILCFDTCGQGDCVNDKVGVKVPLSNPAQSVRDFAEKIEYLYAHREVLAEMSQNCRQRQNELSWENKARQMVGLYEKCLKEYKGKNK